MSIDGKILAQGYVPTTQGSLYTVPTQKRAYVKFFSMYNAGVSTESVAIAVGTSSFSTIGRAELYVSESLLVIGKDEALILTQGNQILARASTSGSVEYVIIGGEENA